VESRPDAGTKIILLASVIALLIVITGFFSIDRTRKMRDEFFQVTGETLPLSMELSRVLALQTAQLDLLEKAPALMGSGAMEQQKKVRGDREDPPPASKRKAKDVRLGAMRGIGKTFVQLDIQLQASLKDATTLAEGMARDTDDPPALREKEARILQQLSRIGQEQTVYKNRSLQLLKQIANRQTEPVPKAAQGTRKIGIGLIALTESLLNEQVELAVQASESVINHQRSVLHVALGVTVLTLALGIFLVLRILNVEEERRHADSQINFMAIHDPLSGLFNRRHFLAQLEVAVAAAHRYEHPLSLCICNLDDFKQVNDTHGHQAGDEVIRQFGKLIQKEIRADDFAGRYGGDEFCIALNHTPAATAGDVLERMRSGLADLAFRDESGKYFQVSATFGVADLDPDQPGKGVLIESADQTLNRARGSGGNRVEIQEAPGASKPAST